MIWGATDSTAAPYTTNTIMHVHTDLIVAATNQKSWVGEVSDTHASRAKDIEATGAD